MKKTQVLTIFLGSFLSFALEPMIGRTLLPVFGGSPSVWVTCLAAFQVLMIGGYAYGGSVGREVRQIRRHLLLLGCAAFWCAGVAFLSKSFLPALSELTGVPALDVLVCVLVLSGLAFVLLSANSTLVQLVSGGDYRLYAVSNAGSLAGLLAYPLVFEPFLPLSRQWLGLGAGLVGYAALLWALTRRGVVGMTVESGTRDRDESDGRTIERPDVRTVLLWLLLPALSCALLNATTAHLTLDVMPMPLLWAVLLALFLLSYVIGFSGRGKPSVFAALAALAALAVAYFGVHGAKDAASFHRQLLADGALVLFGSTFLHAQLYAIRPSGRLLPRYYLFNVIGGAAGGVLTSVVAPLVFTGVGEFPLCVAAVALTIAAFAVLPAVRLAAVVRVPLAAAGLGALVLLGCGLREGDLGGRTLAHASRGFFGTVRVMSAKAKMASGAEGEVHEFIHGSTVHGVQARIPGKERMATCYYTSTGCGYAIEGHPKFRSGEPMRVNLVGLGVGVLYGYGRKGDYYRAYEISPEVLAVATNAALFGFIADCPAEKSIVLGDARKGLEAELAAGVEPYDVIVVDAFTGDNIPYHLSSREAFELYFKLLKPDGIVCVNISNWHLQLEPYIKRLAEDFKCPLFGLFAEEDLSRLDFGAKTAFFCRDPRGMGAPPIGPGKAQAIRFDRVPAMGRLPTDDCGSFVSLLDL